ncbi:Nucleoredoxin [Plecturocebus cupreus]
MEVPWETKLFKEVISEPFLRNDSQFLESSSLSGSHIGHYFSAHGCSSCQSLTQVLYFSDRFWLIIPSTEEAWKSHSNWLYGIQDIPYAHCAGSTGQDDHAGAQGVRVELLNNEDCWEFHGTPSPFRMTESQGVKQLIQPIAKKVIVKYKAKKEETPLPFFCTWGR